MVPKPCDHVLSVSKLPRRATGVSQVSGRVWLFSGARALDFVTGSSRFSEPGIRDVLGDVDGRQCPGRPIGAGARSPGHQWGKEAMRHGAPARVMARGPPSAGLRFVGPPAVVQTWRAKTIETSWVRETSSRRTDSSHQQPRRPASVSGVGDAGDPGARVPAPCRWPTPSTRRPSLLARRGGRDR